MVMGSPTSWRLTGGELIYMRKKRKPWRTNSFTKLTMNETTTTKTKQKQTNNKRKKETRNSHQEAVKTNDSKNIIILEGSLREGTWEDVRVRGRTREEILQINVKRRSHVLLLQKVRQLMAGLLVAGADRASEKIQLLSTRQCV